MIKVKLPIIQRPCENCPFRIDSLDGWLGEERAEEIANAWSFVCHLTTRGDVTERKQCAGFMLLRENESTAVRVAKLLKIDLGLKGRELVFNTEKEFIEHHKN